jgi:hypothetical protein
MLDRVRAAVVVNLVLTLVITAASFVVPVYERDRTEVREAGGVAIRSADRLTLVEVNGATRSLAVLLWPLAISLIPLVSAKHTAPAGGCLLAFVMVAGASIGLFYLPGAVILTVTGLVHRNSL